MFVIEQATTIRDQDCNLRYEAWLKTSKPIFLVIIHIIGTISCKIMGKHDYPIKNKMVSNVEKS